MDSTDYQLLDAIGGTDPNAANAARHANSEKPVGIHMSFENERNEPVTLNFVHHVDGSLVEVAVLAPGESIEQNTFTGRMHTR